MNENGWRNREACGRILGAYFGRGKARFESYKVISTYTCHARVTVKDQKYGVIYSAVLERSKDDNDFISSCRNEKRELIYVAKPEYCIEMPDDVYTKGHISTSVSGPLGLQGVEVVPVIEKVN